MRIIINKKKKFYSVLTKYLHFEKPNSSLCQLIDFYF